MDNSVFVVRCEDYASVEGAISQLLDSMGGVARFVENGDHMALKVNLLRKALPQEAVTTHPGVVAAVAARVVNRGATALIVDSPGGGFRYSEKNLRDIYVAAGMDRAAESSGATLNMDTAYQPVSCPEGELIKHFEVIRPVVEADGVINLCKLKTHTFMGMTGAVKNSFGVIPGLSKPGYHAKLADTERFAGMLLDLSRLVAPRLTIMDAVVAMEGDGPGTGAPRPVGFLLGGVNPLAVDVVAEEIIGLPRVHNPILCEAEQRGLTPTRLDQVTVVGVDPKSLRIPKFKLPTTRIGGTGLSSGNWLQKRLEPLFKNGLSRRPVVDNNRCIACGACVKGCPMAAITLVGSGKKRCAAIDDSSCIRCYCCHEMCPEAAVRLKGGFLYGFLTRG